MASVVLDAADTALETLTFATKTPVPPQLAAYRFQPGHPALAGGGRPKGSKNATTILLEAAPKLMKAYVKEAFKGNATLLVDSRKWIMPDEQRAGSAPISVNVFVGELPMAAMPLPVVVEGEMGKSAELPIDVSERFSVGGA